MGADTPWVESASPGGTRGSLQPWGREPACLLSPGHWQQLGLPFQAQGPGLRASSQSGCSGRQENAFVTELHFLSSHSLKAGIAWCQGKMVLREKWLLAIKLLLKHSLLVMLRRY